MKRLLLATLAFCGLAAAETGAVRAARAWCAAHQPAILSEFIEFLKIPNIAANRDDVRRNAAWLTAALQRRGARTALFEVSGAPPVVFGEFPAPGAAQTVVFYAHYDGQPVDPRQWQGSAPFEPSLRGGQAADPEARLYARSVSDDKAPIVAMLAALDALKSAELRPSVNLKFVFEGEEEAGSARLGEILAAHRDAVKADFWLICDGPVHQTRRQQIYFGARGVTGFNLTVYGPVRDLHSGHYGGWAPNPAMLLAQLVASMKDAGGRVRIPGFYDGSAPLGPTERRALAEEPLTDEALKRELLLGRTENAPRKLIELINEPSLNLRGLESAATGAASRNVVPAIATASFDVRLVKGNDPRAMLDRVKAFIRAQGYYLVENREPTAQERLDHPKVAGFLASEGGYRAVRTSMDLPCSRQVIRAVEAARGPSVKLPTSGGSVPLSIIEDVVHVPLIWLPIANHDNNQHGHNENLRLQNLWDGVETLASLFTLPQP